ncbi:MAG: RICIN domain-containing protein [Ruminococcus sp.]|nr:RICIN domain-containing protein [Ruminococcus sp.]
MRKILSALLVFILLTSIMVIPSSAAVTQSTIDKVVKWAIDTANDDTHGYSQAYDRRWGTPDYDCASFVISAYRSVGFKLPYAAHCSNIKEEFMKEGFQWIPNTEIDLSTSKYLKPGDVLLRIAGHTEIYIGNNQQCGAHDDYDGNVKGDTYGNEVCPYTYSNRSNWSGILRYPVDKPLNIGTGFYATIVNNNTGKALTNMSDENCENRNVTGQPVTNKANQIWKFDRRSDGTYKITSVWNGLVLDVTGSGTTAGTNVSAYFSNDKPAQKWNVYGEEGKYRFKPMCNELALEVNPTTSNARMWTDNNSKTQYFTINKMNVPQSTYVDCKAGFEEEPVTLWWNMTLYTDAYDVKIYKSGEEEPCMEVNDVLETYTQVSLPQGEYEVVVYSKNEICSIKSMNTAKFTVKKFEGTILGDVDGDGEISVIDATEIQLFMAQVGTLTESQQKLADTDKDGEVSVIDATRLQMLLANLIESL